MRTARGAFAWEFRRQHRIGFAALAVYLLAFVAIKVLVLPPEYVLRIDPPNGLAAFIVVPVTALMFYLIGVFTFGFSGDLAARASIYPAWKFTLPVSTRALAWWPMLYGGATMCALWLVTALLLRWVNTRAFAVPILWPGILIATYLAWTQAFMWLPYGLRGVRVMIAVLFLTALDAVVFIAIENDARELTMMALLTPQLPFAYLLGWIAVDRARRGDVPDWTLRMSRRRAATTALADDVFASPWRAHLWLEWRQHGWTLPAMVGMVVPAVLLLLFIPVGSTSRTVFVTLLAVLIMPPFLAAFAAGKLATSTTFAAIRPLSTASLVSAKLAMSILSTLAAWMIAAVAVVIAVETSGRSAALIERAREIIEVTGLTRFFVVAGLILLAAMVSTWKHLVQSLCIGLSGRPWLVKSTVLLALIVLMAIGPAIDWLADRADVQSAIWHGLPWILATVVVIKVIAASTLAVAVHQQRLLSDGAFVGAALCWLAIVAALYGVQVWLAESALVPRYYMAAWAVLLVPAGRIAAAPLALSWSRHR